MLAFLQALDTEALQTDGLDLDVVEQMQGLALKEEAEVEEPELKKTNTVFEKSSLSTKVNPSYTVTYFHVP